MKVQTSLPLVALLLGFLAITAAPLAALPADDPACPVTQDTFLLALAAPEAGAGPAQPAGFVPAPTPAAACPSNFCARQPAALPPGLSLRLHRV